MDIGKMYRCTLCSKTCKTKVHLTQHLKTHGSPKSFKCNECGDTFRDKATFEEHKTSHKRKNGDLPKTEMLQCNFCQKYFIRRGQLKDHVKRHRGDKQFSCAECKATFVSKDGLQRHMISHGWQVVNTYTEVSKFGCKICGKQFVSNHHLKKHIKIHLSEEQYKCDICLNIFTCKSSLKQHKKIHDNKTVSCPKCDKPFHTISYLREHIKKIHTSQTILSYRCPQCDYVTNLKKSLRNHINLVHKKPGRDYRCTYAGCLKTYIQAAHLRRHLEIHKYGKRFKCNDCPYSCSDPYSLKKHQLYKHTTGTSVNCRICGKTLKSHFSLPRHMKIHEETKKEMCQTCGKLFRSKSDLKKHYVVHTKERNFKCDICNALFGLADNLYHHKNRVYGLKPRQWQCTVCGTSYFTQAALKKHNEAKHPNDPEQSKVQCPICSKTLKNKYSMISHIKRCKKIKNHKCEKCGKCFVTKAEVKLHDIIHTGVKSYTCPFCQKAFGKIGNMKVHMKTYHNNEPEGVGSSL